MDTMSLDRLLELWTRGALSLESAVGYTLQVLVQLQQAQHSHQRTLHNLRADVDSLIAHTSMPPRSTKSD